MINYVKKYIALIVLAAAVLALFVPGSCLWVRTEWINYLLMLVMFGMGLTLNEKDFRVVFTRPKEILIGFAAQFTIMPLLAFTLGKAFALDAGLLAGLVLVGTCPGGTASNVMTYLAKGDVALSVGMTSVNTLLAPIMTPAVTYILLRTSVQVDILSMFLSIIKVVIVPIAAGVVINRYCRKFSELTAGVLPLISVAAITLIVASVVSHNSDRIMTTGIKVFAVVVLLNICGYICGYAVGAVFKLPSAKRKTMSIEIGMQNSGLAASLAAMAFASMPTAAVPGAIFSVWHNISGALLADFYSKKE